MGLFRGRRVPKLRYSSEGQEVSGSIEINASVCSSRTLLRTIQATIRAIHVNWSEADYSKCWGEYNYFRASSLPIVFNQYMDDENGELILLYGWIFDQKFDPTALAVDKEGMKGSSQANYTTE